MRYSVRLNDQAAADLADIVLFIARDNPAAAEKLGLALVETAFSLATFPYRGQQI
jgi:plasmid stabilization system protein ParE